MEANFRQLKIRSAQLTKGLDAFISNLSLITKPDIRQSFNVYELKKTSLGGPGSL